MKKKYLSLLLIIFFTWGSFLTSNAQDLSSFQKKVTEFKLDNGFTFVIVKRDVAPVASFVTYVNTGSANDPFGKSGIAHVLEHMAFKGTPDIGTNNWKKEKPLLTAEDSAYKSWYSYSTQIDPDTTVLNNKWKTFKKVEKDAEQYVDNNQFSKVIQRNGGVNLNAQTAEDQTMFFYSLPENKAELWFSLESDRFRHPVFREFYKEKQVILEERRMRVDSSPIGKLLENFLTVAFSASHYGIPAIGWPSDIKSTTIADTYRFFHTYYVPSNITFAIVGDVDPALMKKYAQEYFGRFPKEPKAPVMHTKEPKQNGERRFVLKENSQPWYLAGYHTVSLKNPDEIPLQLLGSILSGGRTSRLYKRLVEKDQIALQVGAFNGLPGDKYSSLFITYVLPNKGVPMNKIEKVMDDEIQKVKNGDITEKELERAKTNARADVIRNLSSNLGLAMAVAQNQAQEGSWKTLFTDLNKIDKVTLGDLKRVANTYLVKTNRTVGLIESNASDDSVASSK